MGSVSGGVSTYQNTPQDITGLRNNLSQWLQGLGSGYNGQTTTPNYGPMNTPAPPPTQYPKVPGDGSPVGGPGIGAGAPPSTPFPFYRPPTQPNGVLGVGSNTTAPTSGVGQGGGGASTPANPSGGNQYDMNSPIGQLLKLLSGKSTGTPGAINPATGLPNYNPAWGAPAGTNQYGDLVSSAGQVASGDSFVNDAMSLPPDQAMAKFGFSYSKNPQDWTVVGTADSSGNVINAQGVQVANAPPGQKVYQQASGQFLDQSFYDKLMSGGATPSATPSPAIAPSVTSPAAQPSLTNADGSINIQGLMQILQGYTTSGINNTPSGVGTTTGTPGIPGTSAVPAGSTSPTDPTGYVDPSGYHAGGTPTELNPDGTPRTAIPVSPFADIGTASNAFSQIFAQPVNSYNPISITNPGNVAATNVGAAPQTAIDSQSQNIINSILKLSGGNQQSTQSLDQLLGPTSSFTQTIMPALQAQFTAQRTQDLAQAKESAGNLTGSSLANAIANQTNKSLGTEQATIASTLQNLAQSESQRQVSLAGINSSATTAGANTQAQTLSQLLGLGTANTGVASTYGLTQAQIDAQKASQNTSTAATLNNNQAQLLAQQMSQIFGNASQTNSQNASAFLALLNSMSGTGVSSPTTVNTPSSIPSIIGAGLGALPFI